MKELLIIGARGWGREVYDIAKACIRNGANFQVKGFLDDKEDALEGYDNYPPIIGPVETYIIEDTDVFICALGDVNFKKHYVDIIKEKGGEFITLIHPTAFFSTNVQVGIGTIIGPYATLSNDTKLGNFVNFFVKAHIGHDSEVGDFSHIGTMANISGFVKIGDFVTVHPCCNITPHRKIGDHAVVGAGSVVLTNVKPNITVFGNPAKKLQL